MKQETLKKIIELTNGFENWTASMDLPCVKLNTSEEKISIALKYTTKWEHYPLLLRRAVEGWNDKEHDHEIVSGRTCMDIIDHDGIDNFQFDNYSKTDYLTPQEQAIEACLIELLEL